MSKVSHYKAEISRQLLENYFPWRKTEPTSEQVGKKSDWFLFLAFLFSLQMVGCVKHGPLNVCCTTAGVSVYKSRGEKKENMVVLGSQVCVCVRVRALV